MENVGLLRLLPVITVTYPYVKGRRKVFHGDNMVQNYYIFQVDCCLTAIVTCILVLSVWGETIILVWVKD